MRCARIFKVMLQHITRQDHTQAASQPMNIIIDDDQIYAERAGGDGTEEKDEGEEKEEEKKGEGRRGTGGGAGKGGGK
ncbi:hypothetical protein T4D_13035 [Trichinella pseudospiralis]|uniref:Uncharacterized protein n=1 Tax=Trichinella pseudospiralis TaxID=6337 RepID=A0A0V1FYU9_TRIPS|nr:hypothetical protein T4D_13035 [Trichinella pseudospiralis]